MRYFMNRNFILGLLLFVLVPAQAQLTKPSSPPVPAFTRIEAPADPAAIPLYTGQPPGDDSRREPEVWDLMQGNRVVRNVARPTITPVLPERSKATGAAVVIVPGGGFQSVAMDGEGWPTARWLAEHGVAAFVLKYRLNETPADEAAFMRELVTRLGPMMSSTDRTLGLQEPRATADALQALKLVREGATHWNVDPARVGMIGFSAGSVATLEAVTTPDAAARPAFFGYVYGPMAATTVPPDAPPMFAAIAMDDPLFGRQGFGIIESWRSARRPVELHAYETGGHGFGTGKRGTTTTMLLPEFLAWMEARGIVANSH
jgi:acetyl esterase/lipase